MNLESYIRDIPDFPKPGILFKDITPLLAAPDAFAESIRLMADYFKGQQIDSIAAAEARGFLFAAPLALALHKPLIPLRKPGKLPYRTHKYQYDLEYGSAELHVHVDGFEPNTSVLLIDDVLATGGTMEAACKLIDQAGARVHSCAVLVELSFLGGRKRLQPHETFALISY